MGIEDLRWAIAQHKARLLDAYREQRKHAKAAGATPAAAIPHEHQKIAEQIAADHETLGILIQRLADWEAGRPLDAAPPDTSGLPLNRAGAPTHFPFSAAIGAILALGDRDPRPGVCSLEPDWCAVPAGAYRIGSAARDGRARDNEPLQSIRLPAFRVARYHVTNAQFAPFIAAGGYGRREFWSARGWKVCQEDWSFDVDVMEWVASGRPWTQPRLWHDPLFNAPNQPVVDISWYEAQAYSRWLSAELGYRVRLPSEAQWEAAARGADSRIFPWGDDWDSTRGNACDNWYEAPAPVGCYAAGASPCGALDMAGNVGAWTASDYDSDDRTNRLADPSMKTYVTYKGGGWRDLPQYARSAGRHWLMPCRGADDLGFRLVAARPRLQR